MDYRLQNLILNICDKLKINNNVKDRILDISIILYSSFLQFTIWSSPLILEQFYYLAKLEFKKIIDNCDKNRRFNNYILGIIIIKTLFFGMKYENKLGNFIANKFNNTLIDYLIRDDDIFGYLKNYRNITYHKRFLYIFKISNDINYIRKFKNMELLESKLLNKFNSTKIELDLNSIGFHKFSFEFKYWQLLFMGADTEEKFNFLEEIDSEFYNKYERNEMIKIILYNQLSGSNKNNRFKWLYYKIKNIDPDYFNMDENIAFINEVLSVSIFDLELYYFLKEQNFQLINHVKKIISGYIDKYDYESLEICFEEFNIDNNNINSYDFITEKLKYNIYLYNTIFNKFTNRNEIIKMCDFFKQKFNKYDFIIIGTYISMIIKDKFYEIKQIINNSNDIPLELLYKNNIYNEKECGVCYDINKYNIVFECKHSICFDCFDKINQSIITKCMYCVKKIDIDKIKLLLNN